MNNIFDRLASGSSVASDNDDHPEIKPVVEIAGHDVDGQTPPHVKLVTQELLRHGFVEEAQKREVFGLAVAHERAIAAALEPLDLGLRLDTHRGVAFLVVERSARESIENDELWAHPLVRRQRLTLEQSLLVAILRQAFIIHEQESGIGQNDATISVHDLLPQFSTYFGDSGSDAKNESRLLNLLDQLKPHGIVSEVDTKQEVTIRPLIAYLANPESLEALLKVLRDQSRVVTTEEHDN
ncbi:MAG: DUF4194 domain-containing protein [Pirellulales bacterium]